jgi:cysteinyl-tRNA synthetase
MSDRFSMSGDFRGAFVNIKSTLTNVQQSIGDIQTDDLDTRKELEKLIEQLHEALEKTPAEKQEDAQAVAETAKALIDVAKSEKPNQTMLQITGDGLKKAAQNLAESMPLVLTLAGQIVVAVTKLINMKY